MIVESMTLEEARKVLEMAHENYRFNTSVQRWQQFHAALRGYIRAMEHEESRRWDLDTQRKGKTRGA
ncbi:hypothetical protein Cva_00802 [Caedimonas varicaedens]|uniref:Uncharacterized protein n=1 Tax=Caedimonas varicaedens TaxID=1629334 RepID=A0A0K8ME57_9PROT|nr:hypothetical protein Cva_00802 [Caedimonas varicaedens]